MNPRIKRGIALMVSLCVLDISTAQACMSDMYLSVPAKAPHYQNVEEVFAAPPVVEIAIEGTAILTLPKRHASDRWEFGNFGEILEPFLPLTEDTIVDSRPVKQIVMFHQQPEWDWDTKRHPDDPKVWFKPKEIDLPLKLIYTEKGKKPRTVLGRALVTKGEPVDMPVRDSVIMVSGNSAQGNVNEYRPYRIDWADPAVGRHQWIVKEAIAEEDLGDGHIERKAVEVKAETKVDGRIVFRGQGSGHRIRVVLEVVAAPNDTSPLPAPITITIDVYPTPAC